MQPLRAVLLPFAFALGACSPPQASTQLTQEEWRDDLQYLARELPRSHLDAFHTVSREQFATEVAQLDARIPALDDDERLVGMMRIVALVGDGHTHLDLPPSWPRVPIEFAWFGDELRVVAASAANPEVLGARVLAVGGVPVSEVLRLLSTLVPRGENEGRTRLTATMLLAAPAVLHGTGLSRVRDEAVFSVETPDGASIDVTLRAVSPGDMTDMRLAVPNPPLWLHRLGERWWSDVLSPADTVYLAFRSYAAEPEFRDSCAALGRSLDESGAQRFVIDLRMNGGGNFELVRRHLIPLIRSRPAICRPGGVYVITGPATFSAAMVNALDLRNDANAVLVGEPTGARPNSYSEHGELRLPKSGLRVSFSTQRYRFGADEDTAVVPDKAIEPTWEQFRAGRDPVMEWIVAQPIR